jgi:dihydroxyacetone kinase-like protein
VSTLRECILAAADAVDGARDELGRLDAAAGDGDHGVTMSLAARAVRKALDDSPDAAPADLLMKVAMAMGSVGGASGPVYATAVMAVAGVVRGGGDSALACAEAAEDAIAQLGHATPGDKTVLDALHPAVAVLRSRGDLRLAAQAARKGAEATAQMVAAVGRASRLGERSRGVADPGATSLAIILGALADCWAADVPS